MVFPAIRLHQLYSFNLCENIDIIFEDLSQINIEELKQCIISKKYENISVVKDIFNIDTNSKTITLIGNKINDKTYIVKINKDGELIKINYTCSNDYVKTCIEYLYHMYMNLV
jgi:hypothetical protein